MPVIDPLSLDPDGPHDIMLSYWFATMNRLIYWDVPALDEKAMNAVGATLDDRERFEEIPLPGGDNISRVDIYHLDSGDVVLFRGTTPPNQIYSEILESTPVKLQPWTGEVVHYFGRLANLEWGRISGSIGNNWMTTGHSLGGSVAGLVAFRGAVSTWTIGQPREGDQAYIDSRDRTKKLRIYNVEDLVARVPFSVGRPRLPVTPPQSPFLQPSASEPKPPVYHWGVPARLSATGLNFDVADDDGFLNDVSNEIAQALTSGRIGISEHAPEVYAFRIRRLLPYEFPAKTSANTLANLPLLDEINEGINLGPLAADRGAPVIWNITRTASNRDAGPFDPVDAVGDWVEIGDVEESQVFPFSCEGGQ